MVSGGMTLVLDQLAANGGLHGPGDSALRCALALNVDGVALNVLAERNGRQGGGELVWYANTTCARLDEIQFTLGEGPTVEAAAGEFVLEADLAQPTRPRSPAFTAAMADLGVAAVFAMPLHIGAIRLGVFTVYRIMAGSLTEEEFADALTFVDAATALMIDSADGHRPVEVPRWLSDPPAGNRTAVHQATGMISVQLGVGLQEALVRLRAHAFRHDRPLHDVARDVVARRLRFE